MKKLLLPLLLCPFTFLLGQDDAGLKNVIGGQFNFRNIKGAADLYDQLDLDGGDGRRVREYNFFPYAAWKIADHWLLGFRIGYGKGYEKRQFFFGSGITYYLNYYSETKGLRLIGRYYFRPAAKFGLFIEPTLGYLSNKTKQRQGGSFTYYNRNSNKEFNFMASPGLAYQFSKHLGLLVRMGQVGYGFGKQETESTNVTGNKYSNFYFDFNLNSLYLGLEYRWGKTKTESMGQ